VTSAASRHSIVFEYRRNDGCVFPLCLNGDDLRRDPLVVRKATLASVLAEAAVGIRFNEHNGTRDGGVCSINLQAWPGRHRQQAEGLDLSLRPLAGLAQEGEPGV
jgi:hypothetical protein